MIEDIRKKHERRYNVDDINESSYCDHLRMREVDALFAALDEARGKVEKAIEQCDTEYGYVPVVGFKLIRRILKGGGDG